MGVQDGKPVSAAYTNPIFLNKNQADTMPFILSLSAINTATISDIQATANKLYLATGASETQSGTVYNATAGTIDNGDSYQMALTILANKFDAATGHKHTGNPGDAPVISVGGVSAIGVDGYTAATGLITLFDGQNIDMTQSGADITVGMSNTPVFGVVGSVEGSIGLAGSGTGTFTQKAATGGSTYGVFWPGTQAAASGNALLNDGAGNLYWAPAGTSSPLTTKGDVYTYSTTNARQPVPGDYGRLIPDSNQSTGWRSAPYTSIWQGSPGKNYIQYSDFENGATTGWSLGNVSLTNNLPSGVPTFGSGASGNLSLGIDSSTPLAGSNSLQLVSSAATTVGDFVASAVLTIDKEDQAKVLGFRCAYSPISNASNGNFSGTSSNSFGIAFWDVTNSAWIIPAGVFNFVQSSGVGICTGTWQTPANMTQFRAVIYNANATAGAITMDFDDFYCGPQTMAFGPAMSDWASFTPTGSWTTNTTYTGLYRRVGDTCEVQIKMAFSGAPNNAALRLNTPFSIDSTKVPTTSSQVILGNAWGFNSGSSLNQNISAIGYYDTSHVSVLRPQSGTGGTTMVPVSSNTDWWTVGSGDQITVSFSFPVSGWSSNTVMSSDTDTRVIAALVTSTASTSIPNTTWTKVPFATVASDTVGGWSTDTYKCQVTGLYDVGCYIGWSSTTATVFAAIYKNGSFYATINGNTANSSTTYNSGSVKSIPCNSGDTLALYVWQNSGGSLALNPGGSPSSVTMVNSFSISRQSGPAIVTASEKVYLQYTGNGGTSITANTTNIDFTTKVVDSHNAWNGTTFTAPYTGWYDFKGGVNFSSNIDAILGSYQNASHKVEVSQFAGSITHSKYMFTGGLYMLAEDTLTIRSDTSATLSNNASQHWIAITSQ